MKSKTLEELIERIDELHQVHRSLRGIVPYIEKRSIGKKKLKSKTKVSSIDFEVEFNFPISLTKQMRIDLNVLAQYLNQNFIIRLHSLLEYEGIKNGKGTIDDTLIGHEMIEIIHFSRKQYAHRHGKYDPNDSDSVMLRDRLFKTFNIDPNESLPDEFPIYKNRVLTPIVRGTKKYVKAFWEKNRGIKNPPHDSII